MSKFSIYETSWLNLVFEGKNKEYGAYQLRQESSRTTLFAFIVALLAASVFAVIMLLTSFSGNAATTPETIDVPLKIFRLKTPTNPVKNIPAVPLKKNEPKKQDANKAMTDNPQIVESKKPSDDVSTNKNPATPFVETGSATGTSTNIIEGTETGTSKAPTSTIPDNGTTIVGTAAVDVMPEFPGGIKKFLTYVGNNFEKPEIEETVTILMAFVIEKDGSMTDIKVLRNPGYGLDKEAIRVLKAQKTKWKPGIKNGKPVRVLYTLPIKVTKI